MTPLRFRAPPSTERLDDLLARAAAGATPQQLGAWIRAGSVQVDGDVIREGAARVSPGALVTAAVQADALALPPRAAVSVLGRGTDWIAIDKPRSWPARSGGGDQLDALALAAEQLDVELEVLHPLHALDPETGGVWLLARGAEAAAALGERFEAGEVHHTYRAVVPTPAWSSGHLTAPIDGRPVQTTYEMVRTNAAGDTAELVVGVGLGSPSPCQQIRRHLAELGAPIVGDTIYGGILMAGGLRLYSAALAVPGWEIDVIVEAPEGFWTAEPIRPPIDTGRPRRAAHRLTVSKPTLRALRRGHPWILTDRHSSDVGRFRPGTLVEVVGADSADPPIGLARTEGGRIAGRMWSGVASRDTGDTAAERARSALRRRRALLDADAGSDTDAYRLVHGESDGLPGLFVDRLGGMLRAIVTGRSAEPLVTPVIDTLVEALAPQVGSDPPVVRVIHLAEMPEGRLGCVECIRGDPTDLAPDSAGRHRVRERGLSFWVDAGLAEPYRARPGTGLFLDQRKNRAWLAALATGGRWLNLFCHTGAFSVALLAAGAASVTSVDLSAHYLAWLEDNLQLNGLSGARHRSVKMDARRFLERGAKGERYHGIILDPPTAAAAGRRFWSVRRQGRALVAKAFRRLRRGGVLLVCRNDRSPKPRLIDVVLGAARDAERKVARAVPAPPGPDFPTLEGFPEGDAFRGLLVWA